MKCCFVNENRIVLLKKARDHSNNMCILEGREWAGRGTKCHVNFSAFLNSNFNSSLFVWMASNVHFLFHFSFKYNSALLLSSILSNISMIQRDNSLQICESSSNIINISILVGEKPFEKKPLWWMKEGRQSWLIFR